VLTLVSTLCVLAVDAQQQPVDQLHFHADHSHDLPKLKKARTEVMKVSPCAAQTHFVTSSILIRNHGDFSPSALTISTVVLMPAVERSLPGTVLQHPACSQDILQASTVVCRCTQRQSFHNHVN